MGLQMTASLKKSLSGLYFSEWCDQKGWAYVPAGNVLKSADNNIIEFEKGSAKIRVRVPLQFLAEIIDIAAFDYLACQVGTKEKYDNPVVANPLALCWIKQGRSLLQAQLDALEKAKIPLAMFSIKNILAPPAQIEIKWDMRPGKEWLDELDDKRDQAESDDDYF